MAKRCGKPVKVAKNGVKRGSCTNRAGHQGKHGNKTCSHCGVALTKENSHTSHLRNGGWCKVRALEYACEKYNRVPRNVQRPGSFHTFTLCGCSGILPPKGESNKFSQVASCRVSKILGVSQVAARKFGHTPIDIKTPHSVIRELMEEENCWRCSKPLSWEVGAGKTPHLHHNHETGAIYGFTHPHCNPQALEHRIDELEEQLKTRPRTLVPLTLNSRLW